MSRVFSGVLLRAMINSREFRLEEIATVTGLSWGHLNRLCRGEVRPSTRTIELLAEVLGCDPGDLFADDGKSRALPPPGGKAPPPLSEQTREQLRRLLDLGGHHDAA
jgi:transcriptional regulator with XRE-family HTH domain